MNGAPLLSSSTIACSSYLHLQCTMLSSANIRYRGFLHSAADKRWAPGTVAAASAAARLAVQGLCTALGALQADVAASSKADLLSLLCTMKEAAEHGALQGVDLLPAVDQAASTLSALL